jgi:hypothetical protein
MNYGVISRILKRDPLSVLSDTKSNAPRFSLILNLHMIAGIKFYSCVFIVLQKTMVVVNSDTLGQTRTEGSLH